MVRLRRFGHIRWNNHKRDFNPTMVRLRPSHFSKRASGSSIFQSHYGAIATLYVPLPNLFNPTDFNPTMVRLRPGLVPLFPLQGSKISIPLWCDCDLVPLFPLQMQGSKISIPLWCDCDTGGTAAQKKNEKRFQSHYGAIATRAFHLT